MRTDRLASCTTASTADLERTAQLLAGAANCFRRRFKAAGQRAEDALVLDVAVIALPLATRPGSLVALAHFVLAPDCAQRFEVVFVQIAPALERLVPDFLPGLFAVIPAHEDFSSRGRPRSGNS